MSFEGLTKFLKQPAINNSRFLALLFLAADISAADKFYDVR